MVSRKSRTITNANDIEYILSLKEDNITTTVIMELFGAFSNRNPKFHPYDLITIPAGIYGNEKKKNKKVFVTTVGQWIFNRFFIEPHLVDLFGYVTDTISKKTFGKLNKTLSYAVMEDRVSVEVLSDFMNKTQMFMPYISITSIHYSEKLLTCSTANEKKRNQIIAQYEDRLNEGDEVAANIVEKKTLEATVEYMGDDPAMDRYKSEARASIGNNFKNMYVMKGAIKDPDPNAKQRYKIAKSNYMDGISADEYALFANSLAAGPYARAKKTENGGYREKLFLRAFQHLMLDPEGSDCGTSRYIKVKLTNNNIDDWMYCYIIDGSRLVELTSDKIDRYIGKEVKMRFSSVCESKTGICNKCMGNMYYRLNKHNVGTSMTQIASVQKNISMKAFHDSTQSLYEMNLEEVFQS